MTLKELFIKYQDYTDKERTHKYGTIYDKWIGWMNPKNILCLGCAGFGGGDLLSFAEYYPDAMIVGLDVDLKNINKQITNCSRIRLEQLNAYYVQSVAFIRDKYGDFDIIIDDALHQPNNQYKAFCLWKSLLKRGGVYIIEDVLVATQHKLRDKIERHKEWTFEFIDTKATVNTEGDDSIIVKCQRITNAHNQHLRIHSHD